MPSRFEKWNLTTIHCQAVGGNCKLCPIFVYYGFSRFAEEGSFKKCHIFSSVQEFLLAGVPQENNAYYEYWQDKDYEEYRSAVFKRPVAPKKMIRPKNSST